MIDGVDDRGGLVEVGERALPVGRLDHHQPRFAGAACDSVAVRGRAGRERGHERAVAVQVPHTGALRPHAVCPRRLRGEVWSCQVGAGVDHGDRDSGCRLCHRFRDLVGMRRGVLPLECGVRRGDEARLCPRVPGGRSLDVRDSRLAGELERERLGVTCRPKLGDSQCGDPAHDPGGMALEGLPQGSLARVGNDCDCRPTSPRRHRGWIRAWLRPRSQKSPKRRSRRG